MCVRQFSIYLSVTWLKEMGKLASSKTSTGQSRTTVVKLNAYQTTLRQPQIRESNDYPKFLNSGKIN